MGRYNLSAICAGVVMSLFLFFGLGSIATYAAPEVGGELILSTPGITYFTPESGEYAGEITIEVEVEDIDGNLEQLEIDISKHNENDPGQIAEHYPSVDGCGGPSDSWHTFVLYTNTGNAFGDDDLENDLASIGISASFSPIISSGLSGGTWTMTMDTSVNDIEQDRGICDGYYGFVPTQQLFPNDVYTFSFKATDARGWVSGEREGEVYEVSQAAYTLKNKPLLEEVKMVRSLAGSLVLIIDAAGDNLSHVILPGRRFNAQQGDDVYGTPGMKEDFENNDTSVVYDPHEQTWTIDFGVGSGSGTEALEQLGQYPSHAFVVANDGKVSGNFGGDTEEHSDYFYASVYSYGSETFLQDLTVDGETVDGFDPTVYDYTVSVPAYADDVYIAARVVDAATFHPDAHIDTGSQATSLSNNIATVSILSADGGYTQDYTVTFEREEIQRSTGGGGARSSTSTSLGNDVDEDASDDTQDTEDSDDTQDAEEDSDNDGDDESDAYRWAYDNGITTMSTEAAARLDEKITRAELAKMMSVYARDILGKDKITNDIPAYNDIDEIEGDLRAYIILSFQLGLMGRTPTGEALLQFNPHDVVTRAEFATVLSRVLFGDTYENPDGDYFTKHIQALQEHGLLSNTSPLLSERRGWIMLMLMRGS